MKLKFVFNKKLQEYFEQREVVKYKCEISEI